MRLHSLSKDGKTVVSNLGYLSLLQVASYAFPLLTMPYLAKTIGPEGFGKISFALAVIAWVRTVTDWGFNLSSTRDVAQCREDKDRCSAIFSNVFWARCFLLVVSAFSLLLLIQAVPYMKENSKVIWLTFLMVPGYILFPDWFFQAMEKMKYTTIFNISIKSFFTIAVFFVIKDKDDYLYQPLLTAIGYFICGLISIYLIVFKWGYSLKKPKFRDIFDTIHQGKDIFINELAPNFYNSFSIMLLGVFGGASANGIYDGGNKFANIFIQFQNVLTRAFYPYLSRKRDKHYLFGKVCMLISVIVSVLLFVFSRPLVNMFLGPDFMGSVSVLRIMSVSLIFLALNSVYGTNYLLINRQEKLLRNITILGSLVGMIASFPLIYFYSQTGAAIVILISRAILGILPFYFAKKIMRLSKQS